MTKQDRLIAMVDKEGFTVAAAAKALGVHRTLYYIAKKQRAARGVCECCGQLLPARKKEST